MIIQQFNIGIFVATDQNEIKAATFKVIKALLILQKGVMINLWQVVGPLYTTYVYFEIRAQCPCDPQFLAPLNFISARIIFCGFRLANQWGRVFYVKCFSRSVFEAAGAMHQYICHYIHGSSAATAIKTAVIVQHWVQNDERSILYK